MADETRRAPRRIPPGLWVSTTYFAEGYPYSIVNNLAEVLFKELGAGLRLIGMTALFHLPWNLKFLWGPLLDRYETKRRWLLGVELVLTVLLAGLALCVAGGGPLGWVSALFLLLAFSAATHDIAIDGFYLEGLDERGQSRFVGYRAMAYKVASLAVRGPLLIAVGWMGWAKGLSATAAVMALLAAVHFVVLPRVERPGRPWRELARALARPRTLLVVGAVALLAGLEHELGWGARLIELMGAGTKLGSLLARLPLGAWLGLGSLTVLATVLVVWRLARGKRAEKRASSYYAAAFHDFLAQAKVGRILAFVMLFRAGESFLGKMRWPFLRDELGMSLESYGFANGTLGVMASFVGTLAGGWLISRQGLRRWIWPCALAQNVLTLLYVGLAMAAQRSAPSLATITAVITIEHFGEGVGTAVLMVYLMRCCDPRHKAAHMALLTALMSVAFTLAGVSSGFLAEAMGFVAYFGASSIATLPGMALIPLLPYLDGRQPSTALPAADR